VPPLPNPVGKYNATWSLNQILNTSQFHQTIIISQVNYHSRSCVELPLFMHHKTFIFRITLAMLLRRGSTPALWLEDGGAISITNLALQACATLYGLERQDWLAHTSMLRCDSICPSSSMPSGLFRSFLLFLFNPPTPSPRPAIQTQENAQTLCIPYQLLTAEYNSCHRACSVIQQEIERTVLPHMVRACCSHIECYIWAWLAHRKTL